MKCMILAIGNELLNGDSLDSNSFFLDKELQHYPINVIKSSQILDDMALIVHEIQTAVKTADYLFITGGLGPTEDDLTRNAVAKAFHKELLQNSDEKELLLAKFAAFGRNMAPNNEKQTYFPEQAQILANPIGTASGFYLNENECHIFVLPGVPSEMKHIYKNEIIPLLDQKMPRITGSKRLVVKTIGIGESVLDLIIKEEIAPLHNLNWEINAKSTDLFLKLYPKTRPNNDEWIPGLKESLKEKIADYIYAYDDDELGDIVADLLLENRLSISTVESCTGGYVAKYLTDRPGSSAYFLGSLVTYANDLKSSIAQVNPQLISIHGAVSKEVVEAMSVNGKKILGSNICLAIVGVAGPTGGTVEKPVGTVWFALVDHKNQVISEKRVFNASRKDIREKSLFYALNMLRLGLKKK